MNEEKNQKKNKTPLTLENSSPSLRFIAAYNSIDYSLRTVYDIKRATSFSDAVRRAARTNFAIKKFEEDLIDYARLRNSIVHTNGKTMAEPYESVVESIEHIAKILATPPYAMTVGRSEIIGIDASLTLAATMARHYETTYRNLPVFKNGAIIGVANLTHIADTLAEAVFGGQNISEYINKTPIEEVLRRKTNVEYFVIANEQLTISEALTLFGSNRRLACIVFTPKGINTEKPTGILTTADTIELNRIIDEY